MWENVHHSSERRKEFIKCMFSVVSIVFSKNHMNRNISGKIGVIVFLHALFFVFLNLKNGLNIK